MRLSPSRQNSSFLPLRLKDISPKIARRTLTTKILPKSQMTTILALIKLCFKTKSLGSITLSYFTRFTMWKTTISHSNFTHGCKRKPRIWRVLIRHHMEATVEVQDVAQASVLKAIRVMSTRARYHLILVIKPTAIWRPVLTNQNSQCSGFQLKVTAAKNKISN